MHLDSTGRANVELARLSDQREALLAMWGAAQAEVDHLNSQIADLDERIEHLEAVVSEWTAA